jgi:2-polyprenyl-3-methyl-5-hydroxy-6-metoxy-1,4-benzoquinol methylase
MTTVKNLDDDISHMGNVVLKKLGNLEGKQILDNGTGRGEYAARFALRGAQVTALGISPGMIERATEVATRYGVNDSIKPVVGSFEDCAGNIKAHSFDMVF